MSALKRGSQSELEASCPQQIKSKCLPRIISDINYTTACWRERNRRETGSRETETDRNKVCTSGEKVGGEKDVGTEQELWGTRLQEDRHRTRALLKERWREKKTRQREGTSQLLTCMPMTAYMKNSITISRATYGRAWREERHISDTLSSVWSRTKGWSSFTFIHIAHVKLI